MRQVALSVLVAGLSLAALAAGQSTGEPEREGDSERTLVLQRRIASLRAEHDSRIEGRLQQAELALQAAASRAEQGRGEGAERAFAIAEASLAVAAARVENARLRAAALALEGDRRQLDEQQAVVDSAIEAAERALEHEPREVPPPEPESP